MCAFDHDLRKFLWQPTTEVGFSTRSRMLAGSVYHSPRIDPDVRFPPYSAHPERTVESRVT